MLCCGALFWVVLFCVLCSRCVCNVLYGVALLCVVVLCVSLCSDALCCCHVLRSAQRRCVELCCAELGFAVVCRVGALYRVVSFASRCAAVLSGNVENQMIQGFLRSVSVGYRERAGCGFSNMMGRPFRT